MFCPKCGIQQPDNQNFCSNCGSKIVRECNQPICTTSPSILPNKSNQTQAKVRVNRAGRALSGIWGVLLALVAFGNWHNIAKYGGTAIEIIAEVILLICTVCCLLISFKPELISSKLRIKLEHGRIFTLVLILIVALSIVTFFFLRGEP